MSGEYLGLPKFHTEKKVGLGEDAEPIGFKVEPVGDVLGVFDGMGGAGAIQVPAENEMGTCTMAKLASKTAAEETAKIFLQWGNANISSLKQVIERAVVGRLQSLANRQGGRGPDPRIRGTILAEYPTTVAIAVVRASKESALEQNVKVLWAGDSRVYFLDPDRLVPLQAITRDHTEAGSGGDGALSRYASAKGLMLEERDYRIPSGAVVIAMTDGCFGYWSHFRLMYTMIDQILRSHDFSEWLNRLRHQIMKVAQDDSSLAISSSGLDFEVLKAKLEPRFEQITTLTNIPETKPVNPFVLLHNDEQYFEFLNNDEEERANAVTPRTGIERVESLSLESSAELPSSPQPVEILRTPNRDTDDPASLGTDVRGISAKRATDR